MAALLGRTSQVEHSVLMDEALYFGEQHAAVREMVRSFAREAIAPIARAYHAKGEFPGQGQADGRARIACRTVAGGVGRQWP